MIIEIRGVEWVRVDEGIDKLANTYIMRLVGYIKVFLYYSVIVITSLRERER